VGDVDLSRLVSVYSSHYCSGATVTRLAASSVVGQSQFLEREGLVRAHEGNRLIATFRGGT
jgi:hypothetical protein